jgi:hypothetical protein
MHCLEVEFLSFPASCVAVSSICAAPFSNTCSTQFSEIVVALRLAVSLVCPGPIEGWSSSPGRIKNFLFSTSSRPALAPIQPPIQWVPGVLSPGVKRSGSEADRSLPTSAEVKKTWIYTSTPPYAFMA